MGNKKRFQLPDLGLKTEAEIEKEADKVLAAKAEYFAGKGSARKIPIAQIHVNPNQPRKNIDPNKLAELKASLESKGLIEPIIVRLIGVNEYQIICGERRYRAVNDLGWKEIDAIVRENISDDEAFEIALIENIQRADLDPIEEAEALYHLLEKGTVRNQTELAKHLGLSKQTVSYKLALASLPSSIKNFLSTRVDKLTEGHVRSFNRLNEDQMIALANRIIEEGLTVRQTEDIVSGVVSGAITLGDGGTGPTTIGGRTRTITNPSRIFKVIDTKKSKGLWLKDSGNKFIIEAKGALRKEDDPNVRAVLEHLFEVLFHSKG